MRRTATPVEEAGDLGDFLITDHAQRGRRAISGIDAGKDIRQPESPHLMTSIPLTTGHDGALRLAKSSLKLLQAQRLAILPSSMWSM